jgi:hypothetical protein
MSQTSDELADAITETHVAYFRRHPKGQVEQTCLIECETGEAVAIECGWGSSTEREFTLGALRLAMIRHKAVRYAIWSEVWTANKPVPEGMTVEQAAAEHVDAYVHGDITADPNRVEAVFTLVVEGKGRMITRLQRIIRGRNGGVRKLELITGGDDITTMGGALADLMPERTIN